MPKKKEFKRVSDSSFSGSETLHPLLIVLSGTFAIATIVIALLLVRWKSPPVMSIPFSFTTAAYNLRLLTRFDGGFARILWAYSVFASISALFLLAGNFIFSKILRYISPTGVQLSTGEKISISWFLGSWICGMFWFLLGHFKLFSFQVGFYSVVFGFFVLFLFFIKSFNQFYSGLKSFRICINFRTIVSFTLVLWIFSWSVLCAYPQYYWDTLMTDWALPGFYVAESGLAVNPFHVYSYHGQNSQLLIVWTLLAKSREASYLLVWGFFAMLVIFIYGWMSRTTSKTCALCTVAVLTASEIGIWLGVLIKNDLQLAVFLILQWWALTEAFKTDDKSTSKKWVLFSGIFAGIALGHKFTGAPVVFSTGIGLYLFFLSQTDKSVKQRFLNGIKMELIFVGGLVLSWSPWLIRNFVLSGNPFYPFLNSLCGTKPLYPWHAYKLTEYTLIEKGFAGFTEYFRNLTRLMPVGEFQEAKIWWGPSAWVCFLGFFSILNCFNREIKWISSIAIVSWLFSLFFALKPPYHAGPLIFVFVCCFGWVLNRIFQATRAKFVSSLIILSISVAFCRTVTFKTTEKTFLLPTTIMFSGFPPFQHISSFPGGTHDLASINEIAWVNHLINKYTPENDKVIFVGSVRPAGIERKHFWGFSLGKQPMLYFAEESDISLKDKLLSMGIRHIVFDPTGWERWLKNDTVDGSHNNPINSDDLDKINKLLSNDVELRFKVPTGKLIWYTIKLNPSEIFEPLPIDSDDCYEFAIDYTNLAGNSIRFDGKDEKPLAIFRELEKHVYSPDINCLIYNNMGAIYAGRKNDDTAIVYFSKAITENPMLVNAIKNRALIYARMGKIDLAIKDWDSLLRMDANNPIYRSEREKLLQMKL